MDDLRRLLLRRGHQVQYPQGPVAPVQPPTGDAHQGDLTRASLSHALVPQAVFSPFMSEETKEAFDKIE